MFVKIQGYKCNEKFCMYENGLEIKELEPNLLYKLEFLNKEYEKTYGKKVDYTISPIGITQEKLVLCLELMIKDNLSLLGAYDALYNK